MAVYTKFDQFTKDLLEAKHAFGTHTFKVMLTDTAPVASNSVKGDLVELTAGNGYTAGGTATTITISTTGGVAKATATDIVFTSSGGTLGPFRYAVLYNDTQTSPAKPLVAWWDYGSSISLASTETLTVDFDGTNGLFTIS